MPRAQGCAGAACISFALHDNGHVRRDRPSLALHFTAIRMSLIRYYQS